MTTRATSHVVDLPCLRERAAYAIGTKKDVQGRTVSTAVPAVAGAVPGIFAPAPLAFFRLAGPPG